MRIYAIRDTLVVVYRKISFHLFFYHLPRGTSAGTNIVSSVTGATYTSVSQKLCVTRSRTRGDGKRLSGARIVCVKLVV